MTPVDPWSRWSERQRHLLEAIGDAPWPVRPSARPGRSTTPAAAAHAAEGAGGEPRPAARPPVLPPEARAALQPAEVPAAVPREAPVVAVGQALRPEGLGGMEWPALAEAASGCRACRLCEGRTQVVFGTGRHDAHWLVVGEAPGEQEDRQGLPFVGKSGQLLDAMLAAIGVSRDPSGPDAARAAYIANTVKCRPPGNRNPQPDELAQCEPFLIRQIELLRPKIILAMGRFAVQSLLRRDDAIGRLRGAVHRYQGVPLVVTYHPAYLLRNPLDKARAWEDLCLAREVLAREAAS